MAPRRSPLHLVRHRLWVALLIQTFACRTQPSLVVDRSPDARMPDAAADRRPTRPDAGPPDTGIDPALRAAIFAEVEDYLTADDPGSSPPLLAKLDAEYSAIPFSVLAEAVRHRPTPAKLPAAGVHQAQWTDPPYKGTESYHAYVPAALPTATADRFPLLIFLHGAGGNGEGIAASAPVQQVADRLGTILVAPTSNAGCDWNELEDCMAQVVLLARVLKRRFPIDDARVVLSGFSMGGRGSFSTGVAYPEPYCGVVSVAGSIGAVYNTADVNVHKAYCCPHVENLHSVRLRYISGDQDMALMLYQNRGCDLCLQDLGYDYVYTELKGQGHVWPLDLWESAVHWTLAKPRPTYPSTVVYNIARQASAIVAGGIWLQKSVKLPQYWADIDSRVDSSKPARLKAELVGNKVTLDATNVAEASVYVADGLLDLDKPVVVLWGASALHQGTVVRDRRFLLTEARRRADRTMIFANRLQLKLTP